MKEMGRYGIWFSGGLLRQAHIDFRVIMPWAGFLGISLPLGYTPGVWLEVGIGYPRYGQSKCRGSLWVQDILYPKIAHDNQSNYKLISTHHISLTKMLLLLFCYGRKIKKCDMTSLRPHPFSWIFNSLKNCKEAIIIFPRRYNQHTNTAHCTTTFTIYLRR